MNYTSIKYFLFTKPICYQKIQNILKAIFNKGHINRSKSGMNKETEVTCQ